MLWAKLDEEGVMTIEASEPMEAFALRQWERLRKAGMASLVIRTGTLFNMDELLLIVGKDMQEWQEWRRKRQASVVLPAAPIGTIIDTTA